MANIKYLTIKESGTDINNQVEVEYTDYIFDNKILATTGLVIESSENNPGEITIQESGDIWIPNKNVSEFCRQSNWQYLYADELNDTTTSFIWKLEPNNIHICQLDSNSAYLSFIFSDTQVSYTEIDDTKTYYATISALDASHLVPISIDNLIIGKNIFISNYELIDDFHSKVTFTVNNIGLKDKEETAIKIKETREVRYASILLNKDDKAETYTNCNEKFVYSSNISFNKITDINWRQVASVGRVWEDILCTTVWEYTKYVYDWETEAYSNNGGTVGKGTWYDPPHQSATFNIWCNGIYCYERNIETGHTGYTLKLVVNGGDRTATKYEDYKHTQHNIGRGNTARLQSDNDYNDWRLDWHKQYYYSYFKWKESVDETSTGGKKWVLKSFTTSANEVTAVYYEA